MSHPGQCLTPVTVSPRSVSRPRQCLTLVSVSPRSVSRPGHFTHAEETPTQGYYLNAFLKVWKSKCRKMFGPNNQIRINTILQIRILYVIITIVTTRKQKLLPLNPLRINNLLFRLTPGNFLLLVTFSLHLFSCGTCDAARCLAISGRRRRPN